MKKGLSNKKLPQFHAFGNIIYRKHNCIDKNKQARPTPHTIKETDVILTSVSWFPDLASHTLDVLR